MKFVEPQIYLIAETRIDSAQLREMLASLGEATALEWLSKTQPSSVGSPGTELEFAL